MRLLLDTCAVLWFMSEALSETAVRELRQEFEDGRRIGVSPISAWEISSLYARGRFPLPVEPHEYFRQVLSNAALEMAPLTPKILIDASLLPGSPPRDPADRILAASARALSLTVARPHRTCIALPLVGLWPKFAPRQRTPAGAQGVSKLPRLVTRDRGLLAYAEAGYLSALAC